MRNIVNSKTENESIVIGADRWFSNLNAKKSLKESSAITIRFIRKVSILISKKIQVLIFNLYTEIQGVWWIETF